MKKQHSITINIQIFYALIILTIVGVSTVFGFISEKSVAESPAGFWRGSGKAKRIVDLKIATANAEYNSEFWFIVNEQGDITDGRATVVYDISLDDAQLRSLIGYANSVKGFALGKVPGVGSLLGTASSLTDIAGVRMAYNDLLPVREGKIRGRLKDGILQLEWASPPPGVPYKSFKVYVNGTEEVLTSSDAPAYSPWSAPARVTEVAPGHWDAVIESGQRIRKKDNVTTSTFWTAYRVGDAK